MSPEHYRARGTRRRTPRCLPDAKAPPPAPTFARGIAPQFVAAFIGGVQQPVESAGREVAAMSESTEFRKEEGVVGSAGPTGTGPPSCRKKKSEVNEGFVKDLVNHIDEFVNASYDEHKSCLQKTVSKMFGMNKAMETRASAPPPVVSVLPLRVDTSTGKQNAEL